VEGDGFRRLRPFMEIADHGEAGLQADCGAKRLQKAGGRENPK